MEDRRRFSLDLTVQFEDVDMYGVVHHARYIHFMERARVAALVELGFPPSRDVGTAFGFMVASVEVSFVKPSRLLDELRVETFCTRAKGPMLVLGSRILSADELRAEGQVKLVHIGPDNALCRLPAALKKAIA